MWESHEIYRGFSNTNISLAKPQSCYAKTSIYFLDIAELQCQSLLLSNELKKDPIENNAYTQTIGDNEQRVIEEEMSHMCPNAESNNSVVNLPDVRIEVSLQTLKSRTAIHHIAC